MGGSTPRVLAFLPAATLAAYWYEGEGALVMIAFVLPLVLLLAGWLGRGRLSSDQAKACSDAIRAMDEAMGDTASLGRTTGCFVIQFDEPDRLRERFGRARQSQILGCCIERIRGAMRFGDTCFVLEDGSLAVVLAPVFRLDVESMVQIAARLQSVVHQPIDTGYDVIHVTCSIGFCQGRRAPGPNGQSLLDAAQVAADEAMRHRPGAIRSFSGDIARARASRDALRDGIDPAMESGEICAYFQPQISTDTGAISGMEALVRWHHPDRGCLLPADFLPAVEEGGLSARMGQLMIKQALSAIVEWDRAGFVVPTVSVNFSAAELTDRQLPERLRWELDRLDLAAGRLTVEVLETVVATTDFDAVAANIAAIAEMGCGIDLDDFGTGNASISSHRRFPVRRLKIDRSFVTKVDEDREQQQIVAAILSMAERLGLETLAEGVETKGEHAVLSQLGCGHVQGYAIARPLPLEDATDWIERHSSRLFEVPRLGAAAR